jgi:hypothetical protein
MYRNKSTDCSPSIPFFVAADTSFGKENKDWPCIKSPGVAFSDDRKQAAVQTKLITPFPLGISL